MKLKQRLFVCGVVGIVWHGMGPALAEEIPEVAKKAGCQACHGIDKKVVGPAWAWVAYRYKDDDKATAKQLLMKQMNEGGRGKWTEVTGGIPMPPYGPRTTMEQREELAEFILSLEPLAPPK